MDQRESSVEEREDEEGELSMVGEAGEDAERKKGGREEDEGELGVVLVRMGAKREVNGVEDDDVETDESAGEEVEEGGRWVVLRLVGLLGRGD